MTEGLARRGPGCAWRLGRVLARAISQCALFLRTRTRSRTTPDTLRCVTQRTNRFLRPRGAAAAHRAAATGGRSSDVAGVAVGAPRRSPPPSPARATAAADGAQPPPVPGRQRSGKNRNRPRRVVPDQSSLRRAQSASPRQLHAGADAAPAPAPARASTPGAGELRPTPRAATHAASSASDASGAAQAQAPACAEAPNRVPTPSGSPPPGVPVPEHVVEDGPVDMPDHIDEDLRNSGKSDFVIAGIQRRRDAAAASHAVRTAAALHADTRPRPALAPSPHARR